MKVNEFLDNEPFQSIFEYATIAILLVDENGIIKLSNPYANSLFGYRPGELTKQNVEVLIPNKFKHEHSSLMEGYFVKAQNRSLGAGLELSALKKDNSIFPVEISLGNYNTKSTKLAIVFLTDITHRKQVEKTINEDEKRLLDIIQSIGDAFMGFTNDWRYLYLNDKALSILHKTREEIIGKSIWEIFPHSLGETFERQFKERQDEQLKPFTIKTNSGPTWWQVRIVNYDDGKAFLCSDITETENEREARHESEEQFSVVFNSSPAAISITELETGIVKDINLSHTLLYGFSRKELIGKSLIQVGIFKNFTNRNRIIKSIRDSGPVRNIEATAITKTGNSVQLLISADIIHLTGVEYLLVASTDISANKVALEELQRSEERFAKAFKTSPVALSISTLKNGRVIEANNSFLELLEYKLEEVVGKTAEELKIYPTIKDRDKIISQLREYGYIRNKDYTCITKNKKEKHVIFSMETIELRDEMCVITTALDITDKKIAEDKLKTYTDVLEQRVTNRTLELTQALEREKELSDIKSRFVSIASHEFRTPLSTILSSTYLLEQIRDCQEEDKSKHLNRIRSAVKNLTFILTEFLSLDKLEQRKVNIENELFDLDALSSEVIDEVRIAYRLSRPIEYTHSGTRLLFQDKRIIKNILLNVVSNSAKYSPSNKLIQLKTVVHENIIIIYVKDEGIGIPLEDQKYIYTNFFRAHNANHVSGTGLGLSITKRYIELLEGSIDFTSQPGEGTEFKIILPKHDPATDKN